MVYVYELMENYSSGLQMAEKYGNLFKLPGDALELSAKFHMKLSQFDQAKELYRKLLVELKRDNWKFFELYIQALRENDKPITAEIVSDVKGVIDAIESNRNSPIPLRIIHLGRLHISFLLYKENKSTGG